MRVAPTIKRIIYSPIAKKSIKPLFALVSFILMVIIFIELMKSGEYECKYRHSEPYTTTINNIKINPDGKFINQDARTLASMIYSYRTKVVFNSKIDNNYINVFGIQRPSLPYNTNELNDLTLYKLITCDIRDFDKMMFFVYVFNSPLYESCIKRYDPSTKKFVNQDDGRLVKDIIIKSLLKFGDENETDLRKSIEMKINENTESSKLSPTLIKAIVDTLVNMPDEQLYKFIVDGLVK